MLPLVFPGYWQVWTRTGRAQVLCLCSSHADFYVDIRTGQKEDLVPSGTLYPKFQLGFFIPLVQIHVKSCCLPKEESDPVTSPRWDTRAQWPWTQHLAQHHTPSCPSCSPKGQTSPTQTCLLYAAKMALILWTYTTWFHFHFSMWIK